MTYLMTTNCRCVTCGFYEESSSGCHHNPPITSMRFPIVDPLSFCGGWSFDETRFYDVASAIEWFRVNYPAHYRESAELT